MDAVSEKHQWQVGWVCPTCGLERQRDYHDPCLGHLPGIVHACCGHGGASAIQGYLAFENGTIARFAHLYEVERGGNQIIGDFQEQKRVDLAAAYNRPIRIQRKRTKGWKMPENTVYVGRGSMWGNYAAQRRGSVGGEAVKDFCCWIADEASWAWKARAITDLRGRNLACWCALDKPCHADVLLARTNAPICEAIL